MDTQELLPKQKEDGISGRERRNVVVIAVAFTFVFSAYNALQGLQSSLNQAEGLGVTCLAILYGCIIVSSIFSPVVIKTFGVKTVILISWTCHAIYVGANFYSTWATLIPASILLGLVSGPLWVSQCMYIASHAYAYAHRCKLDPASILSEFNGVFVTLYQMTQIGGNLISSLVFYQDDSNNTTVNITKLCGAADCPMSENATRITPPAEDMVYILLGTFLVFDVIAFIFSLTFLPSLPKSTWAQAQSVRTSVGSCCRNLSEIKLLLILPLGFFTATAGAIFMTDFSKVSE
jgi:hypothetical protein